MLSLLQRWLSRRFAPVVIIASALLLALPSVVTGRGTDDFVLAAAEEHADIARGHAPFDLFAFATGDTARLRDIGVFPWWADSASRIHFFRPLASLGHALDRALWDSPAAEHLHSLAWYALALAMLWLVLRQSGGARWVAALGLLLYAVANGHAGALGWISARNGLMAAAFGFATLWAHGRWRRGLGSAIVPIVCFTLALASGESGVATAGYLIAYCLVIDSARLRTLMPYAVILAGFAAVYALGGYGAANTTQYIDPGGEPLRFAGAVATRLPIYLATSIGGPASDAWIAYPMIHPVLPYAMWALAVALVGGFLWLARPLLRADRESRFWLVGSLLATMPACAGFPSDRLLLLGGAGTIVVVSRFVVAVSRGDRRRRIAVAWLVFHGLVLDPIAFVMRAHSAGAMEEVFAIAERSLPADPSKTVVIVNAPMQPMIYYALYERVADGRPRPAHTHLLATGTEGFACTRIARDTLRLSSASGLLSRDIDMMLRAPDRDLEPGDAVDVAGMRILVDEVTADGRPAIVRFQLDRELEDPQLVWLAWSADGLAPFAVPAIGKTVAIPAVSLVHLFSERTAAKRRTPRPP